MLPHGGAATGSDQVCDAVPCSLTEERPLGLTRSASALTSWQTVLERLLVGHGTVADLQQIR